MTPAELTATPRYFIATITPSGNTVVERVTLGILRSFPGVSGHFSRTEVRGNYDAFAGDYDWDSMMRAAQLLSHAKPDIICWNGSKGGSIGFDIDRRLCERITAETGCPATTSTLALADALEALRAKTIGFVTPYTQPYQQKIIDTFAREGYRCAAERHAGLTDNLAYASYPADEIRRLTREVAAAKPDVIVPWCTNFLGAPLAKEMEDETGIPFYDSTSLGIWHCLKRLGLDTKPGAAWGSLFGK